MEMEMEAAMEMAARSVCEAREAPPPSFAAQEHELDLEAAVESDLDTAPLLSVSSFTSSSSSEESAASPRRDSRGALRSDAWPGGRKVCYAWRCFSFTSGLYYVLVIAALVTGLSIDRGSSCGTYLRLWSGLELGLCTLGLLNVTWRYRRVPQLVVDRTVETAEEGFIAASRLTIFDILLTYSGMLINMVWIAWLVLGCIWSFGKSDCSVVSPVLDQIVLIVLYCHLSMLGMMVALIVCGVSALPVLYFLKPELFVEPPRGATKSLIDSTTLRLTYQPSYSARMLAARPEDQEAKTVDAVADEQQQAEAEGRDDEEKDTCAICLSEYMAGEEIRELRCRHRFHASCAESWLETNKTCAACRRPIDLPQP